MNIPSYFRTFEGSCYYNISYIIPEIFNVPCTFVRTYEGIYCLARRIKDLFKKVAEGSENRFVGL